MPLTARGRKEADDAGKKIKSIIGDEPVAIYCSPYLRTKQTLAEIIPSISSNPLVTVREEPRMTGVQLSMELEPLETYRIVHFRATVW